MASYAGIWVFAYVCVFPLFVFWKLLSYNKKLKEKTKDVSELRYGFLIEVSGSEWSRLLHSLTYTYMSLPPQDYKHHMPCIVHEGIEMMRKLALSVVGAFFTNNSTMAVALAMIVSIMFFGYHCHFL